MGARRPAAGTAGRQQTRMEPYPTPTSTSSPAVEQQVLCQRCTLPGSHYNRERDEWACHQRVDLALVAKRQQVADGRVRAPPAGWILAVCGCPWAYWVDPAQLHMGCAYCLVGPDRRRPGGRRLDRRVAAELHPIGGGHQLIGCQCPPARRDQCRLLP